MPCCSASHCKLKREHGVRCFRFPRDPERRRLWVQFCARGSEWSPREDTLCEVHFDDDQFDQLVLTHKGNRKLKKDAVPTLIVQPKDYDQAQTRLQSRQTINNKSNTRLNPREIIANDVPTPLNGINKPVYVLMMPGADSSQQTGILLKDSTNLFKFKPVLNTPGKNLTTSNTNSTAEETTPLLTQPQVRQVDIAVSNEVEVAHESNTVFTHIKQAKHPLKNQRLIKMAMKQNLVRNSYTGKIALMEKRIKHLRAANALLKAQLNQNKISQTQMENMRSIFNKDQLDALSSQRPDHWTEETIKQCVKIRMACGRRGYDYLISLGYPLPSYRTLYRAASKWKTKSDLQLNFTIEDLNPTPLNTTQ